jgi:glutathione S-transferase
MVALKGSAGALTLFGFPGSSTTNRLRLALTIKGIPFTFHKVDLGSGEQRTHEYHNTRNRLEQVPLLQLEDGTLLRQSVAILEYLEEAYPGKPKLLPDDPVDRSRVREVVEIVNSYIQPMQNKLTVEKVAELDDHLATWLPKAITAHTKGGGHDREEDTPTLWPQWWIMRGLEAIESLVDDPPSKFCFGNQVTLADCALGPQVIGAKKYGVNLEPYPKIRRIYDNLFTLEEVTEGMTDVLSSI